MGIFDKMKRNLLITNTNWKGVFCLANELPVAFEKKMAQLLGNEAEEFFAIYREERTAGLRINPLKISREEWERINPFPLQPIPFVDFGYYYPYKQVEPGKHP